MGRVVGDELREATGVRPGVPTLWAADRYRAAQQEVSGGLVSEASSAAPHRCAGITTCTIPPPSPNPPSLWKNCLP